MSINWVMIAETGGYTPLPGEQTLYTSPARTTLSLQTANRHTPSQSYSQQCKSGVVYLTNRRIIYLPVSATPTLQSFAVPILNVTDSRVTAPWFGANKWEGVIQPVHGGGIPPQHSELEMVMEFKEGGAFDFATTFERLKERLKQAVEVARENEGAELGDARGAGTLDGVNLNSVHLDELPAYEESGQHAVVPVGPLDAMPAPRPLGRDSVLASSPEPCVQSSPLASPQRQTFSPPSEPPPGYEEVQRGSIVDELERRLREPEHEGER